MGGVWSGDKMPYADPCNACLLPRHNGVLWGGEVSRAGTGCGWAQQCGKTCMLFTPLHADRS